jgi:uncharacterized membrane protein YccC
MPAARSLFRNFAVRMRAFAKLPWPNRAGWHQAIRMTLAALLADLGTAVVGLQHGYWAVITCLIIVQGSLGATIAAGIARLAGTGAGVVLGGIGVLLLRMYPQLPVWVVLLIVIGPLALLVASKPVFRVAPLTGALVLLLGGLGDATFAVQRFAEIVLGCVVGVMVSLFVLPERATAVLVNHAAGILDLFGEFAVIVLMESDPRAHDDMVVKIRNAFTQIQNDMKEVNNERGALLLRSDPFPARLMRHLQRLRTDVNMLGRAVAPQSERSHHAELAASIKLQFAAAAAKLRNRGAAGSGSLPSPPPIGGDADTPLGFAFATLQRELAELDEALQEQAMPERLEAAL